MIPSVTEEVRDFGLGQVAPASMTPVIYGVSSLGAQNAFAFYSSADTLRQERGEGLAVETAANVLAQGGGPIGFISADPTIAASNGAVAPTGTSPLVTVAGTATIDAHLRVEIVGAGALGVGKFRYTVDSYTGDTESERTYSETLIIPSGGTFAIPNLGITLTFAAGSYIIGDFYTVDVEAAAWNATDLADAIAALTASSSPWRYLVAITSKANGDAAAHATLAAALQSHLTTLANASKYRRAMIPADAGESTPAQVVTAFAATTAIRCLIPFGMVKRTTTKPFPGYSAPVTHAIDVFAARAARSLPSTDLKRVKSGPLEEVIKLFHDEYKTPSGLDDAKISTLRTWENLTGFFVTQGRLKSPSGSDFTLWPRGIVMDIACETAHQGLILSIGRGVRFATITVNNVTYSGVIDDRDATTIEEGIAAQLVAQLVTPQNAEGFQGHVTDLRFRIIRTHNVLQTGVVLAEVGILPLGYIDHIKTVLGFVVELPLAA